jgi:hypothetical protein
MHYGWLPEFIDHIDFNRQNNNIINLRAATRAQNNANCRARSASGAKNVYWVRALQKWVVRLWINTRYTHVGVFDDLDAARFVASEYRDKYHGEFACHE